MPPSIPSHLAQLPHAVTTLLYQRHPSTEPFFRALLLGWAASSLPATLRVLLRAGRGKRSLRSAIRAMAGALASGLRPRGLGVACAVSIGGARWAEDLVEPAVRRAYFAAVGRFRLRQAKGKERETSASLEAEQQQTLRDEFAVKLLSTFFAATFSSLTALLILQSSSSSHRSSPSTRLSFSTSANDKVDLVLTPYAPTLPASDASPATPPEFACARPPQSPTLDLTLFVLVRAADTFIRAVHERAPPIRGRYAPFLRAIVDNSDTLLFSASASRIMWCWFYKPHLLPPTYSNWILQLARMDPGLLQLLRFARQSRFVYGKVPDVEVAAMCTGIAAHAGRPETLVNPVNIARLDCSFVHGKLGAGSCEVNAIKRWARAFLDALLVYLPVHVIPPLLFNFRRVLQQPGSFVLRILLAASRSSAFLATFVASVYAGVCLVRTRLPQVIPSIPQQPLDSGLCVLLGCLACGWSVLVENKRRRREMALYCAPRALYAVLDEVVPQKLTQGKMGEVFCRWVERAVFATSSGTIISAAVHRPDLVSGIVSGVTSFAVRGWHRPTGGKTIS
ncbi:hypothetical protein JCM11251_006636 [Rhodosporidiobolus azoricus]